MGHWKVNPRYHDDTYQMVIPRIDGEDTKYSNIQLKVGFSDFPNFRLDFDDFFDTSKKWLRPFCMIFAIFSYGPHNI